MFEESVRILDRRRLEIKQWLSCDSATGATAYQVDTWFFLPAPLQVNRWTYSPQWCLKRLKTYLRQRAPLLPMDELANGHPFLHEARALLTPVPETTVTLSEKNRNRIIHLFKMYQLLIKRSMYARKKAILEQTTPEQRYGDVLMLFIQLNRALRAYRSLRPLVAPHQPVMDAFRYCDEYIGIIVTHHMHSLLHEQAWGNPRELRTLRAYWKGQMRYRLAHSPASVPCEDSDNELPVYRWSVLKKYVADPLFFDIRRKRGNSLLVHTIYSFSAALAMIFATAIAFVWQEYYGALSSPLFVAMVVGYIFKDRIKELCREHLFRVLQHHVPDCRQNIYTDTNTCIGTCNESFRFLDEDRQFPLLRTLRDKQKFASVRHETILHCAKQVHIKHLTNPFRTERPMIMEIWRFDISDFLGHILDTPEELPTLADEHLALGEKVYYVNMVRRVHQKNYEAWERCRLVLNHEGIKRVETLRPLTPVEGIKPVPVN